MWENLNEENREKYKKYISNFASLSEVFSQKNDSSTDKDIEQSCVAPIVNSKFQETVFQKSFGAIAEDIANTSYDASLIVSETEKYLVGIKSFGLHSGDQKIAQFKRNSTSENWEEKLSHIKRNSDKLNNKIDADIENANLYLELAKRIATLRNDRIASSMEQIRGFEVNDTSVEAVYHVLMPSKRGEKPQIFVGEIEYLPIDIDNIKILGSTNKNTPTNFKFTDGKHSYKYTSADSQLYMSFHNKKIILDTWDINYVKEPFYLFENLHLLIKEEQKEERKIKKTVSWMIQNKRGEVEKNSGFNGFDGASKLSRDNNYREVRIDKIKDKYSSILNKETLDFIIEKLKAILIPRRISKSSREEGKKIRSELVNEVVSLGNKELLTDIEKMVYRPESEMYIPIPKSKLFHTENPDFFGKNVGTFKEDNKTLALKKKERIFKLKFLASGEVIESYISQDSGKGIQSVDRQDILGNWILKGVFQLDSREPLTAKRLEEIGINAIRLTKYEFPDDEIGIEFLWIDIENPPDDAFGWVAK